ncbi:type II toxin-antitoxin system HipA family toxin [Epilithonimonas sp. UC225_85]|uniref:type II toxin-antitoxin system HipA family toxin n=1 Tax=Epilithonimonas sp. UC225_85 TaxID=3350167 RepID=UPI0036D2AA33
MKQNKVDILVYADWIELSEPQLMGVLSANYGKGKKSFSFEYTKEWLKSDGQILIDPDLQFFSGTQYPNKKENFGVFMDSMPDTWGRTLMKRKAAQFARDNGEKNKNLYDIDYLLGVYDHTRMGALRFKISEEGNFLDDDDSNPTPPWSSLRELEAAVKSFEEDDQPNMKELLALLVVPGSSLGGARPKANVLDENGNLWIAKFPSKNDTIDKAAWEYLAYRLAINVGINMSETKIQKLNGSYHTFFTKRFDRNGSGRIHFSSAMTMTGKNEDILKSEQASYLDILDFIETYGTDVENNLKELWRRIIFNICISNTDDHLRNHGFLLTPQGWVLSPAYDLNPSVDKDGLALNIDMDSNSLDLDLAKEVGQFFRLGEKEMDSIIEKTVNVVRDWVNIANEIGISRSEQQLMQSAFLPFGK